MEEKVNEKVNEKEDEKGKDLDTMDQNVNDFLANLQKKIDNIKPKTKEGWSFPSPVPVAKPSKNDGSVVNVSTGQKIKWNICDSKDSTSKCEDKVCGKETTVDDVVNDSINMNEDIYIGKMQSGVPIVTRNALYTMRTPSYDFRDSVATVTFNKRPEISIDSVSGVPEYKNRLSDVTHINDIPVKKAEQGLMVVLGVVGVGLMAVGVGVGMLIGHFVRR